jgi:glycosyltransferase involved in cell wall biosynthesis
MKILYYNLLLGSHDGSSIHAQGLLQAIKNIIGEDNVMIANKYETVQYSHGKSQFKKRISKIVRPLRIVRRKLISKKSAIEIVKKVREEGFNPEYVLARSVLYDTTPIIIARLLGCKLIIEHNTPLSYEVCDLQKLDSYKNVEKFEKEILEAADYIYVVSSTLKNMLTSKYKNLRGEKIIAIPNGYMKDIYFDLNADKAEIRNEIRDFNKVSNKKVVTFIGSLKKWHGVDSLLQTANQMKSKKNIEFWIIGDGEERDSVKEYLSKYDNLKWFGNVPIQKLRDLLWASDLGIMPYQKIDKFYFSPLKMFDMMGAGLPFIGVDIGQIHEIVNERLTSDFLIDNNKVETMSNQITKILFNTTIYDEMKLSIRNTYGDYSWECTARKLLEFIRLEGE